MTQDPNRGIFGIDFAVSVAGGEPQPLKVGEHQPETAEMRFTASQDDTPIRIWDRGTLDRDIACRVGDVQVVAP